MLCCCGVFPSDPTTQPSSQPSSKPSLRPSSQPSRQPSHQPVSNPTQRPSSFPSSFAITDVSFTATSTIFGVNATQFNKTSTSYINTLVRYSGTNGKYGVYPQNLKILSIKENRNARTTTIIWKCAYVCQEIGFAEANKSYSSLTVNWAVSTANGQFMASLASVQPATYTNAAVIALIFSNPVSTIVKSFAPTPSPTRQSVISLEWYGVGMKWIVSKLTLLGAIMLVVGIILLYGGCGLFFAWLYNSSVLKADEMARFGMYVMPTNVRAEFDMMRLRQNAGSMELPPWSPERAEKIAQANANLARSPVNAGSGASEFSEGDGGKQVPDDNEGDQGQSSKRKQQTVAQTVGSASTPTSPLSPSPNRNRAKSRERIRAAASAASLGLPLGEGGVRKSGNIKGAQSSSALRGAMDRLQEKQENSRQDDGGGNSQSPVGGQDRGLRLDMTEIYPNDQPVYLGSPVNPTPPESLRRSASTRSKIPSNRMDLL